MAALRATPPQTRQTIVASSDGGVQPPLLVDPPQCVQTAILELDSGAGDQIADRARDEHLARPRLRGHPGADMHCETGKLLAEHLALARVDARTHSEAELVD